MNSVYGVRVFAMAGPKLWNMLPNHVKQFPCINSFKTALKLICLLKHLKTVFLLNISV